MSHSTLKALKQKNVLPEVIASSLELNGNAQKELFEYARIMRKKHFIDDKVEVRSVIEVSNICSQNCKYCNMGNKRNIENYMLSRSSIINLIEHIYSKKRRFILLQSGENAEQSFIETVSRAIHDIKKKYEDIIIILCLGSLSREQYLQLKKAGADRYILKFETSNSKLFEQIKPNDSFNRRMQCLEDLFYVGFEVGSGNIIGLPGQTNEDIVNDLVLVRKYNLSMNSATVFIPAENSEFKDKPCGDINKTLNAMALMRIMNPHRLMPTTSSLEKIAKDGQLMGLQAGANTVTVHDGTPQEIKPLFPIYSTSRVVPAKEHFMNIVEKANMRIS
ncbi:MULTISPECIES: biotin synthase BioB [unclassified Prosthecochloris]|uniref:biotin synthase BioB n=1 Tax=unclassified Prosthecochloris TaxID=2632826 RepID=UPI00223E365A|nr:MULTISPECIES: radical SAM protein [unclassified Prosthecochloris]UZJ37221.1 radical SAM protein [Prosthecochloris sp. SCSIO W1103]UZJ39034.1 radical SAM protein [Prosthecochloris sp. SCSIO W1102]